MGSIDEDSNKIEFTVEEIEKELERLGNCTECSDSCKRIINELRHMVKNLKDK